MLNITESLHCLCWSAEDHYQFPYTCRNIKREKKQIPTLFLQLNHFIDIKCTNLMWGEKNNYQIQCMKDTFSIVQIFMQKSGIFIYV